MKDIRTYEEEKPARLPNPVIVALAEEIRQGPLKLNRNEDIVYLGFGGQPKQHLNDVEKFYNGKAAIAGELMGRHKAFAMLLPIDSRDIEIVLLREAIAAAPKYQTPKELRDEAFARLQAGDGTAWDKIVAQEHLAAQPIEAKAFGGPIEIADDEMPAPELPEEAFESVTDEDDEEFVDESDD